MFCWSWDVKLELMIKAQPVGRIAASPEVTEVSSCSRPHQAEAQGNLGGTNNVICGKEIWLVPRLSPTFPSDSMSLAGYPCHFTEIPPASPSIIAGPILGSAVLTSKRGSYTPKSYLSRRPLHLSLLRGRVHGIREPGQSQRDSPGFDNIGPVHLVSPLYWRGDSLIAALGPFQVVCPVTA